MAHPQLRLKTQEELDALDAISGHFCSPADAEAFRHAQRVLVNLIGLVEDEGCAVTLTRADGTCEHDALELPKDEGTPVAPHRRWTVKMMDQDKAFRAKIREWSSAPSDIAANRLTILLMGNLFADMADGWVLWASPADGDAYQLVLP